jgi:hypothetical protein
VIPLLADEHFPHAIVAETRAFHDEVDFLSVQDLQPEQTPDLELLEWAAAHGRAIVSYDVRTMIRFASERIRAGQPMAGLIIAFGYLPVGRLVEDLATISVCGIPPDLENRIMVLPL